MLRRRTYQLFNMVLNVPYHVEAREEIVPAMRRLFNEWLGVVEEIIGADAGEDMDQDADTMEADLSFEADEMTISEIDSPPSLDLFSSTLTENEIDTMRQIHEDVSAGKITSNRAPLFVDILPITPGWGNAKDNHFYPSDVIERDAEKLVGIKMFETDHGERSTRLWTATTMSLTGFNEEGAPVIRTYVHDPDFAERVRNLGKADSLSKMECSILAKGLVEKDKFSDGEREGRKVISIEQVGFIDWVSAAGARGRIHRTIDLAENFEGGSGMKVKVTQSDGQETVEVLDSKEEEEFEEVQILESEDGSPPEDDPSEEETPTPAPALLAAEEIGAILELTQLPVPTRQRLAKGQYTSVVSLREAVQDAMDEIAELTKLSHSRPSVFGLGERDSSDASDYREIDSQTALEEALAETDQRFNLPYVPQSQEG